MKRTVENTLAMIGWGIAIASVALRTIYQRVLQLLIQHTVPASSAWLKPEDLVLILIISVLAGSVLVDPKWILTGYVASLFLSSLLMFIGITLPATIGMISTPDRIMLLETGALVYMFRSIILGPIVITLIGSLIGGAIGERVE